MSKVTNYYLSTDEAPKIDNVDDERALPLEPKDYMIYEMLQRICKLLERIQR